MKYMTFLSVLQFSAYRRKCKKNCEKNRKFRLWWTRSPKLTSYSRPHSQDKIAKGIPFPLKKIRGAPECAPIEQFSFYFKLSCPFLLIFPYKGCYFSHFYLILPNFLPIGILQRFLVWRLSGPSKILC
jgi:hypothetical protein